MVWRWCEEAHDGLVEPACCSTKARLAHTLARLALLGDGHAVPETHAELALLVHTRPEEVTKILAHFRREGLVTAQPFGRGVTVCDPHKLAEF